MLKPIKRGRYYWFRYYTIRQRRRHGYFRGPESELFNIKVDTLLHNTKIGAAGGILFNRWAYPYDGPRDTDRRMGINNRVTEVNWRNDMNFNRKRYLVNAKQ